MIVEQVLRLGRRGPRLRPFAQSSGLAASACSRALTDFGAEESFARAAARVQEHYGIEVSPSTVRACTLKHGRAILEASAAAPQPPAAAIITSIDASLIPVVKTSGHGDRRKARTLFWREVRLCSARAEGKTQSLYGATLGGLETTSWLRRETAERAGLTDRTQVHGVGDGEPWILDKFKENFPQGQFLLDFYHVSEYLGKAALVVCSKKKARAWLRRQQGRLLQNQWPKVLRALEPHREEPNIPAEVAPVRSAHRYISERSEHLDYAGA